MNKTLLPALSSPEFELDVPASMIRLGTERFPAMVALVHEEDKMKDRFWGGRNHNDGVHLGWCVTVPMENGALIEVMSELADGKPTLSAYLALPFWYLEMVPREFYPRYASISGKLIFADEYRMVAPSSTGLWSDCEPSWLAELILRLRTYTVRPSMDQRYPQKYVPIAMCDHFYTEG